MTDTNPQYRGVPIVENVFAPEVFASEAAFFAMGPGVITITFTSYRWDNTVSPGVQKRIVIGRLTMPIVGAQALAADLYSNLKQAGLDPVPPPSDPKQVQ
jgi:hypothetical protein